MRWLSRRFFGVLMLTSGVVCAQSPFALKKVEPAAVETVTSKDSGLLETVDVALGDKVAADQVLMKLDHERQLHAYLTAKLRAENRAGIEIAEGGLRDKNASLTQIQNLFRRRQVTEEDVEKAQAQAQIARGQLTQARMQLELSKLEFALAEKLLENRSIRAPMDGTVVEIAKPRGARVNQGDPVLTIADMDNLASEVVVTKDSLNQLSVGSSIPVRLAGSESLRYARIAAINPAEHAKNGEHTVRLVFENLKPGTPLAALPVEALLPPEVEPAQIEPPPTAPKNKP